MEYKIFGPGGSPSEDDLANLEGLMKLDDRQRGVVTEWFSGSKDYDPYSSPFPSDITASTLLPEQFEQAAQAVRGLLWAWQEYGLQLADIERDLLLLGFDSEALAEFVPFLERLSTLKRRVWACEYARMRRFEGLPTIDVLNFSCEARAVFGGDPAERRTVQNSYKKFLGVIPVVTMELITSDNDGNKERIAIQLSEGDLEWLREAIERAHEQLSIMKERTSAIAFDVGRLQ